MLIYTASQGSQRITLLSGRWLKNDPRDPVNDGIYCYDSRFDYRNSGGAISKLGADRQKRSDYDEFLHYIKTNITE